MPNEVTDYTGNAALGLTDTNIPVTTTPALTNVNQLGRDVLLMNHENNIRLYQQKIADRDKLYEALSTGQGSVGNMREEDRKVYNDAKTDANNAFVDLAKSGGINNFEAVRNYRQKLDYLNQVSTQAQARYKLIGDEEQAIGNETRQPIKDARQKTLDSWTGDFWATPKPYQQMQDYTDDDFGKYNNGSFSGGTQVPTATTDRNTVVNKDGKITTKNTQVTKPLSGKQPLSGDVVIENGLPYSISKGASYNWNNTLENATNDYIDQGGFGAQKQRQLLQDMESAPIQQQEQFFGTVLQKAQQYNRAKGFQPDANGNYPQGAIDITRLRDSIIPRDRNDLSKGFHIAISPPELGALYALTKVDNFAQPDSKVFNKDVGDFLNKQGEIQNGKDRNAIAARRANAYIHFTNKKIEDMDDDEKTVNSYWGSLIDNMNPQVDRASGKTELSIYAGGIPQSFRNVGGIVFDPDSKKYIPATVNPIQSSGNIKEYWQPQIIDNKSGQTLSYDDLKSMAEQNYGRKLSGQEVSTAIKYLLKNSDALSLQVKGADGAVANKTSALQSARLINNQTKKKGETGVLESDINSQSDDQ